MSENGSKPLRRDDWALQRWTTILLFVAGLTVFGADDWAKVRELTAGAELRVYKKGVTKPMLVKMDEATADSLLVVDRNAQVSIPKDQIDQVDYRPKSSRVTHQTKTTMEDPNMKPTLPASPQAARVPTASTSSGLSIGSKPDFETIYRRSAAK